MTELAGALRDGRRALTHALELLVAGRDGEGRRMTEAAIRELTAAICGLRPEPTEERPSGKGRKET